MEYKVVARTGLVRDKERLSRAGARLFEAAFLSEDEIIAMAGDADAVIVGAVEPYSRRVIEALEKCKLVSRMGIGVNNIDVAAATEVGLPVAYVPDASITEVSDHAMALVLCFSRNLLKISKATKEGTWQPGKSSAALAGRLFRLSEQTLGLVGLGRIGKAVCGKAKAFGMKVLVHDPYVPVPDITALGAEPVGFEKLLAESDYISLHVPLTDETMHLFKLEQFRKMKRTAYIINTSRGGLIDEQALTTALTEGSIAGAGLDVTDPEPPRPDNPLLKMDSVIITAHTAYYSERSLAELARLSLEAVLDALNGKWPTRLANPEVKNRQNSRLKIV